MIEKFRFVTKPTDFLRKPKKLQAQEKEGSTVNIILTLSLKGITSKDFLRMFSLYNEKMKKKRPPIDVDELSRLLSLPLGGSIQYRNY